MHVVLKAHRHTKAIQCHKVVPKSGPLSLFNNNDKAYWFYMKVKEGEEEEKEQSLHGEPMDL